MEKPVRIQRRRVKGWRMPENTVYVGRGSSWGNPYRIGGVIRSGPYAKTKVETADYAVFLFREWAELAICGSALPRPDGTVPSKDDVAESLATLRGKNLACWCKPGEPCHADVLLELANK